MPKKPVEEKKPPEGETSKLAITKATDSRAAQGASEAAARPSDDRMAGDTATLHRGTPLYGQPSWWGDGDADDENSFKQDAKTPGRKQDTVPAGSKELHRSEEGGLCPTGLEPSYFEIPTKESMTAESSIHEVPTKDTEGAAASTEVPAPGHASFTIEFDNTAPGKVTIRDHVTKYSVEPRPRPRRPQQGPELSTLQAAIMASETKVADWLAQNDPPLPRMESTEDDSKTIKSDVPVHLKRLKGSKHADGTQSDSENGAGLRFNTRRAALEQHVQSRDGLGDSSSTQTPFMMEGSPEGTYKNIVPTPSPRLGLPPGPEAWPRQLTAGCSEDDSPAWSSASVGVQASPSDPPKPPHPDDDHSDKGTYTIELESQNPEELEARRMIDKVFGVEETQVQVRAGCQEQQNGMKEHQKLSKGEMRKTYYIESENLSEELIGVGSPRWVSQWASLAASHTRTDPEGSGAESPAFIHHEKVTEIGQCGVAISIVPVSSSSSQTERKRRTLPQPPMEEQGLVSLQAPLGPLGKCPQAPGLRSEIGEKQDTEPQEKESQSDPHSAGRVSSEGVAAKGRPQKGGSKQGVSSKTSGKPICSDKQRKGTERGNGKEGAEKGGKPLVRQGSFTIDKPSANVPLELIPRIGQSGGALQPRRDSAGSLDTATLLQDTQAVMAFLEAKLRDDPPSYPLEDSLSPESDIDTASTVSQAAGEAERKAPPKRRTLSSMHREKGTISSAAKVAAGARERMEKKAKPRLSEARPSEARRPFQTSARGRQTSLDLTDDDLTSSLPHSTFSDVPSSDQEPGHAHSRAQFTTDELLQSKLESKAGRSKSTQMSSMLPGKPATLPRPRPTRASLLRRARLGEASDSELADADRASVASEVSTTSSTSRPPSGRKASRIDLLAQPRRTRLGSLSARSDSEATPTRSAASTHARVSTEMLLRLGFRSQSGADTKPVSRGRANSVSKLPDAKSKITSAHSSPSASTRWRRLPPEYASTSEDEFGSNRHPSKHTQLRPGSAPRGPRLGGSAPSTPGPGSGVMKHRAREQEEYIRDWTAHSEEIARISQDLAKDLAMLAREIHDVAGEIDSVSSSGTAPSTTVSTAATTPGSAIDTREELVDRVFDESLNFRKTPPTVIPKAPEINGRPVELRPRAGQDPQTALRRRTWNRDEAVLDSLLLTSLSQLSAKIRQNVDKTAGKLRILFKDKDRNWEEIEGKLKAEGDVPLLKTSNKEIASILQELKRVEKQLQVINVMVDPDGTLDALTSLGFTSPTLPKLLPGEQRPLTGGMASSQGPDLGSMATGPQGPVMDCMATGPQGPHLVSGPPEESGRDLSLPLTRFTPSGEENSLSHD
ncbi:hypothetical protein AGOR_G00100790 [Albula goreensis]|uniref:CEP170 C-terminal domain-containing protein n=1 Tax=Albula goreensis TaxID=1534307 RepID=A0A8T3DHM1_9TELE|nr:hypothetical protein AGOR_G00100790 [Albula goreensis]